MSASRFIFAAALAVCAAAIPTLADAQASREGPTFVASGRLTFSAAWTGQVVVCRSAQLVLQRR